jgi:hypothetical protein
MKRNACGVSFEFRNDFWTHWSAMEADDNLLPLITDLNAALEAALGSLAGKSTDGEATYLVWMASHVFRLVEGYIKLRNAGSTYASKLMVRPVIESVTVAVAAAKKTEFFVFQARKEHREAKRLLGEVCAIYKAHGQSTKEIEGYIADTLRDALLPKLLSGGMRIRVN